MILAWLILLIVTSLSGCTGVPEGVKTINDFEISRYTGTWYEIARLDHPFERGLENISASYSLNKDGSVNVINKGWDQENKVWKEAEGTAYFIGKPNEGRLKVSFFGPFYGAYNIIELDNKDYAYSMVTGPDRSYLWILSRTPQLPKNILASLIDQAKSLGFATDKLIFVRHDQSE